MTTHVELMAQMFEEMAIMEAAKPGQSKVQQYDSKFMRDVAPLICRVIRTNDPAEISGVIGATMRIAGYFALFYLPPSERPKYLEGMASYIERGTPMADGLQQKLGGRQVSVNVKD